MKYEFYYHTPFKKIKMEVKADNFRQARSEFANFINKNHKNAWLDAIHIIDENDNLVEIRR